MLQNLINDTQYECTTLFEHGLADSARFAPRFDELSATYAKLGMGTISAQLAELASLLRRSGFGVAQSGAESATELAAKLLATIWEYLRLATDRLWYYKAKEA
jgi:hypothetical protein